MYPSRWPLHGKCEDSPKFQVEDVHRANLQGIVSSNIYRAKEAPWYPLGHGIVLMYILLAIISTVVLQEVLRRENARRNRGERDEVIEGKTGGDSANGCFKSVEEAMREKGDEWSGYRYVL